MAGIEQQSLLLKIPLRLPDGIEKTMPRKKSANTYTLILTFGWQIAKPTYRQNFVNPTQG
jgi:hypothetical protein